MKTISVAAGTLCVMSGIPGSGKSTVLSNSKLPQGVVQSSDELRKAFGGTLIEFDRHGRMELHPQQSISPVVWETLSQVAEARAKLGLTTIIDATLVADEVPGSVGRSAFAAIAQRQGVPFKVLIVDTPLEDCLLRNADRPARVPERTVREFFEGTLVKGVNGKPDTYVGGFESTSRYPHEVIDADTLITVESRFKLPDSNWDVIGDIHGMLEELKVLLTRLGYGEREDGNWYHPAGRRILFLGDIVDRGPFSLEALRFVKKLCDSGLAVCILGNHDDKLRMFYETAKAGKLEFWKSFANAQTGMDLLRLPEDDAARLVAFIRSMPVYATYEDDSKVVVFAHADIKRFNHITTPREELLHGEANWGSFDSDAAMQRYLERVDVFATSPADAPPVKQQYYVRGHIPGTSWQPNVVSLEAHAYQKGSLLAMRLDDFLEGKTSVVPFATTYDFEAMQAARVAPYKELEALVEQKMVVRALQPNYGLRLYKYGKSVFYDHLWSTNAALLRARGHVYDVAGNLVSQPFDKVFNHREEGAGADLTADTPVRAVEKLNGFLAVVSPHPVKKGEVLVHTTGSFDSKFVGYIQDFISGALKGRFLRLFAKRRLTLTFECIHPEDPHIIQYAPEQHGLYLIGAREIRQGSDLLRESELDMLAAELELPRPAHFETTFGELLTLNAECRGEGYMVRLLDEPETLVLKLKSPYYLMTKFLGRMNDGKWKHLFNNPGDFKKKVDEEFFFLVDALKSGYELEKILAMDEQQKLSLVRELVA
ncbi:AAA family ATPase [Burkholderia cenocepacia]|uniref:AAA family ATPase n=1 Tax=Burkholderia cenocepacia TaxID=95486 RepID=UPI00076D64F2|nr:AAA family ATPase [Burkholderia cenocepacia]KWU17853.1 hypothetical protein AS149_14125 [Burkholderia cenocepacia]